jgi:amino acid adenylation domain-containing protein/non-ribosomal peptide synthase protein (TIGR01720 family)
MQEEIIQGFRLSPQQKHLWLQQQSNQGFSFRARCAVRIRGLLDEEMLEKAIGSVINEHEILRTTFKLLPEMTVPVQVISEAAPASLRRHDLASRTEQEQQRTIEQLFSDADRGTISCDRLPLLRCDLIRLSPEENVLLLSVPALCADDRSLEKLVGQIAGSYASEASNEHAGAMQYADFAEWQNELLESEDSAAGRQHWKHDFTEPLASRIPCENRSSPEAAFQPEKIVIKLDPEVVSGIRDRFSGIGSPSSFVLACWQTLIWRLTGCPDLVIGVAFDGRKYEELENSIGLLARYLPLQTRFGDDDPTFAQLLKRVSDEERGAQQWQEYFAWESSERPVGTAAESYFLFCFAARNVQPSFSANGLSFSIYKRDACIDRFKLKLVCEENDGALALELHYDSSVFLAPDIGRLADGLQVLIADASRRPEAAVIDLEVLGAAERHRILVEFNDTTKEFQSGTCLHELFEDQVERVPDRVAVVYESDALSYAQLNSRANQLAHHLRKLGVGPDKAVGLCLDRSLDLIVGLLGIIKAGGAYVPLDPGLPGERLSMMLEDVGARVLVTKQSLSQSFSGCRTVCLDADRDLLAGEGTENSRSEVGSRNLVYVIFTSGSTGRPKGVAVEHRQLVNYVAAIQDRFGLAETDSFAMVSTLAADLGNTVLFPSLINGGTLYLIAEERATNPDALADYFRKNKVDCLKIVPSHLTALLSAARPAEILPHQRLVLGGEACNWGLIEKIQSLAPQCVVFNHYGPTETTVGAVAAAVDINERHRLITVPLGRQLANTRTYILDKHYQPVPLGAVGELCIGGNGVARGYVNRADLTAEKFVPDPFSDEAGARVYSTGDLARYLTDGRIEFLGRVDHQLKVRGYRIEPGEIEAALRQHPRVTESVVVAREDQPGDKRLVAYVVTKDSQSAVATELRGYLKDRLPEYMLPSAFVSLERLPLTPNGKVDRRALPAPEAHPDGHKFVAPRNHVEEVLAKIWAGVLGVGAIGVDDNFFELGGDSILSIQIIARANQAGLRLSPRQLFQHQTIAALATMAGDGLTHEAEQGPVTGEHSLLPVQARFFELDQPEPQHYNQAILLQIRETPDRLLLERAFAQLLIHHDALRLRFYLSVNGWRQLNAAPDRVAPVELIDLSQLAAAERHAAMQRHAANLHASLNLQDGPIMRVALFDGGPESPSYLLIVIHHLAVDGVSWRVLLEDLETLIRQLGDGKDVSLPAKTTSFKSWAERLAEYAHSEALQRELPYWLSVLSHPIGKLPVDKTGGANSVASARTISVSLGADETRALLQDVPAAYRTQINEVLLTALVRTFASWTDSGSLLLDLEGHGREEILEGVDLSRTVGWFTTIFPVVLDIAGSPKPVDALRSVKEQLRAIPNRGLGYGLLRYSSGRNEVGDQLRALPQAEIRFNYLGQLDRMLPETSLFNVGPESSGPAQSAKAMRAYLLNIIGTVSSAELRLEWTYSESIHRSETVGRLAQRYIEELRTLIAHSRSRAAASYSPSDFPKAKLSQEDLNKVLARLSGSQKEERK